jgi:magnesium transporter
MKRAARELDTRRRVPAHERAAAIMSTNAPLFPASTPLAEARRTLAELVFDTDGAVYVSDSNGRLMGAVPATHLLRSTDADTLASLVQPVPASAAPEMDQEHVAALAVHHNMVDVPVVDADGRFMGVVPGRTLIRVLRQEHVEDMHKLAGIVHQVNYAAHALELSPWRRVRDRLPWLLVGLAGSGVAAAVVASFEATLAQNLAIAFFVPAIVYLADAIGTQTEAVAVRGLSLTHAPLRAILVREMSAGALIGVALGAGAAPLVGIFFGDWRLALAVALSIAAAGGVASTVGLLLPWVLSRHGFDPAFGSGPVATVIQDVLSLIVYFSIAGLLMR